MVGAARGGPAEGRRRRPAARSRSSSPGGRLACRRDRFGALVARECRYWWRDARRRASLITVVVVGVFVPAMVNFGGAGFAEAEGFGPSMPRRCCSACRCSSSGCSPR